MRRGPESLDKTTKRPDFFDAKGEAFEVVFDLKRRAQTFENGNRKRNVLLPPQARLLIA